MKTCICLFIAAVTIALGETMTLADSPVRNSNAELILDFLTAEDGTLDSMDDLLMDADPCDPDNPDVLEPVLAPDGHWITLGELSQVAGKASIKCQTNGTQVVLQLSGLIPSGVYTIWLLTFEAPGFTPDFAHLIGEGTLGLLDGSSSTFVASSSGKARLMVRHPAGALSIGGEVGSCLLEEFEFHLVGAYHPDGLTYGPTPGPLDEDGQIGYCYFIEHFGFIFHSAAEESGMIHTEDRSGPKPKECLEGAWDCQGGYVGDFCGFSGEGGGTCRYVRGSKTECYCKTASSCSGSARRRGLCDGPSAQVPEHDVDNGTAADAMSLMDACPEGEYLVKCPRNGAMCCPEGTRCRQHRRGREHEFVCEAQHPGSGADAAAAPSNVCGNGSASLCLGASVNDGCENNGAVGRCKYVSGSEPDCECKFSNRPVRGDGRAADAAVSAAGGSKTCWEFSETSCAGLPVGSTCGPGGGMCKGVNKIESNVWYCECQSQGRPCRGNRCWRP